MKRGPEHDPYISKVELDYIQSSLGSLDRNENASVPWKAIFTSKPVFAICVSHTAETWVQFLIEYFQSSTNDIFES